MPTNDQQEKPLDPRTVAENERKLAKIRKQLIQHRDQQALDRKRAYGSGAYGR